MPPSGHKTITLREKDYTLFLEKYEAEKDTLERRGVRSFSAYITFLLYQALDNSGK
jgi:hypothetical protein